MEHKSKSVSDDEMRSSYTVPTAIVNRFIVSTNTNRFRLAFGETLNFDDPVNWRIALSLTPLEAWELRNILNDLLKPFESDIQNALGLAVADADDTQDK